MTAKEKQAKVRKVLKEFKAGTLKSSSGEKIKDRRRAIAIALSEAGLSRGSKSDEYWDSYVMTIMGEEEEMEEEENMDESLGEKRCKAYMATVRKNRKK